MNAVKKDISFSNSFFILVFQYDVHVYCIGKVSITLIKISKI